MHLDQDCHSHSLLSGDLRLKRFEYDDDNKYLSDLHRHVNLLFYRLILVKRGVIATNVVEASLDLSHACF